jgi:hypothetical protein
MKPINPEDRPKLIALIAIALVVFGIAGVQVLNYNRAQDKLVATAHVPPSPAAGPPTASITPVTAASGVSASAPAGGMIVATPNPTLAATKTGGKIIAGVLTPVTPATPAPYDPASLGPPIGGKDPFAKKGRFASSVNIKVIPAPRDMTIPLPRPARGNSPVFDATPVFGDHLRQPEATAVILPPPPAPTFTVTGIVLGDPMEPRDERNPSVAVLSSGSDARSGSDRMFVTVGDSVGNGYVVTAIRAGGVDIRSGGRRVTLKIGSNK